MSNFTVGVTLMILVPVLLVAIPVIIAAHRTDAENREILVHGVSAEAEIFGCEVVDEGRLLRYRYAVPGRSVPIESSSLVGHRFKHLVVGAKVRVRYKASEPGVHLVVPEGESSAASQETPSK